MTQLIHFGEWKMPNLGETIYLSIVGQPHSQRVKIIAIDGEWATVEKIDEEN